MAEDESRAPMTARTGRFDGRALLRLGLWSMAATVAVAIAVLVSSSEVGLRRISLAFSGVQSLSTAQPREITSRDSGEMQRLSETLRQINTDRLRMIARLDTIERHLDDLTGSINRGTAAAQPPAPDNPPVVESSSPPSPPLGAIAVPSNPGAQTQQAPPAASQQSPVAGPAQEPSPADAPATTKADFGVDLGSAQTIDGLRVLWTSIKGRHGTLLEGMRPIIAIREPSRPGNMELRLVVGPIPSAALAARLCVVMNAAGAICQPAVFDGQRLALR